MTKRVWWLVGVAIVVTVLLYVNFSSEQPKKSVQFHKVALQDGQTIPIVTMARSTKEVDEASVVKSMTVTDAEYIIYRKTGDKDNAYLAVKTPQGRYEYGSIAYSELQKADDFTIATVAGLPKPAVKVVGYCGAQCMISLYIYNDEQGSHSIRIEAPTFDQDLDGDGKTEIVASQWPLDVALYQWSATGVTAYQLHEMLHLKEIYFQNQDHTFLAVNLRQQQMILSYADGYFQLAK